jgi:hypothetical protein
MPAPTPQPTTQFTPPMTPAPQPVESAIEPITFPTLPTLPTAPQPTVVEEDSFMPEFDLPPLPALSQLPQPETNPQPSVQPQSWPQPPLPDQPSIIVTNRNPVGRPPKPLLSETTWLVDQNDFAWAKAISRDPIAAHQSELRQKVNNQIQRNQPELLTNPSFQPALDQAFMAVCQTYDLAPTARQDLLKSLLNGRIIENIVKSLG